ncbi:MAG TPA: ABC transporter permease [Flavihumibacter sp.]|nr:ABC transporter permease [Bacteroidota bacterium]HOA37830.1 ABC transporter permease [Flavihumibacter sp.]HPZ88038.1 ABC transporter permease [Flavihumibacter sp.]HQD10202.1 ABC transporter permease [Flavihumibacter sp.]
MRRTLEILGTGLKMAIGELRSNKLRTFLSLFGITIGIFCIISVLATVNSLKQNIQDDIRSLGGETVFIDKWDWTGTIPYWKLMNRPEPSYVEMQQLRRILPASYKIAYTIQRNDKIELDDVALENVNMYGVTEDFNSIQNIEIVDGRYLQSVDLDRGANYAVIGTNAAEQLFGVASKAVGKQVKIFDRTINIVGLIKKQGSNMGGGWQFDDCIILPYTFLRTLVKDKWSQPNIMVKGGPGTTLAMVRDETTAAYRSIRKLKPTQADNFSLNDMDYFLNFTSNIFSGINMGGWAIAGLSLFVGMFGVANIMFVTVRERTPQIGLKKAIGAKKMTILLEFLMESAFLCIMGGMIGVLLVFILTKIISGAMGFPISISIPIMVLAVSICIITGLLAGIIPAFKAARLDPVVAIRS